MQKFQDAIIRPDGRAVVGATVTVTTIAGATPTLYSDDGTTALSSNVLTTDSTGEYQFYAANGRYNLAIAAASISSETRSDVVLFDPAESGIVSVADYGVTGNGTTDDTAALEAAINSGSKLIVIPAGFNCLVKSEVDFDTSGVHLRAHGAKITKFATFTGSCVLRIDNTNVTIEGLEIDGTDNADDGLITNATADGFRLLDCTIYNCLYGISALNIANLEISGNRVSAVTRYCARVYNTADTRILTRWRVTNNKFDQSDQEPTTTTQAMLLCRGTATYPSEDVVVMGNTMTHCENPTNSSALCCEFRYVNGGAFTGNFSKNGSMLISVALSNDVTVDGNVCDGATFYGIEVAAISPTTCSNNVISNNVIHGRSRLNYGIGLQGTFASTGCTISGNSITDCSLYGILLNDQWQDVTISGNRISLTLASTSAQYGIYLQGSATLIENVSISGNLLQGGGEAEKAIYIRDSAYISVVGNVCDNWTENGILIHSASGTTDYVSCSGNTFQAMSSAQNAIAKLGTLGANVTAQANAGFRRSNSLGTNALNLEEDIYEMWGTATPEGAIAAGIGSVFRRTDGGAGTSLYIKESGAATNSGWVGK